MGVALRRRDAGDLISLLGILQHVHETQGYPVRAAAVSEAWLAAPEELGAWVALDAAGSGRVVGHVALHPASGPPLGLWLDATERQVDGIAVVTRLFTDGSVPGAGSALLRAACTAADAMGRVPVLQVDGDAPARDFYRRRGWREVGTVRQQWGHRTVDAVACVAPDPGSSRGLG